MEQGSPAGNGGVVNMTRAMEALSPMLNKPRRRIIQVEALVIAATTMLFLQLVLGSCKRRWHNSTLKTVVSLSNAVLLPLILYTFSVMQSSPIKSSLYPVLGVSLLMAAGGTNAVKQYHFHDKKKLVGYAFEMARYAFYLSVLVTLVSPVSKKQYWNLKSLDQKGHRRGPSSNCVAYLLMVYFTSTVMEVCQGYSQSKYFDNDQIVATWMKKKAKDHQNDSDPESLNGYNYLVTYNAIFGKIWNYYSNSDNAKALKDVCLSFTLFEHLTQRYYGFVCAEARLPETKDFLFKGLLPTENDYERAFRITEMELGFCYDFFFTKYHSVFTTGVHFPGITLSRFALLLTKISLIWAVGVYTIKSSLILETLDPIIEVHSTKADCIIALVILFTVLMVEVLQAAFYLASDWFKVSLASWYVGQSNECISDEVIGFLRRFTMCVRLRNMIGQFSLISDFMDYCSIKRSFWNRMMFLLKKKPAGDVTDTMKLYIARSLISSHGNLTNGGTSLRQNLSMEMFEQYDWALKNHHQVELILIWHIATDYCDLASSIGGGNWINQDDRDVAVKLSRYCAYLIAYVPELLPYHAVDIIEPRNAMLEGVEDKLASIMISERYEKLKNLVGAEMEDNPTTIFLKGVKLGKQLELMRDGNKLWKVLADFWAETIIYIAPSHLTVKQHMDHLENGGEFLTYIWAMLSHAGILNLERKKDQGTNPGQFTPEIV